MIRTVRDLLLHSFTTTRDLLGFVQRVSAALDTDKDSPEPLHKLLRSSDCSLSELVDDLTPRLDARRLTADFLVAMRDDSAFLERVPDINRILRTVRAGGGETLARLTLPPGLPVVSRDEAFARAFVERRLGLVVCADEEVALAAAHAALGALPAEVERVGLLSNDRYGLRIDAETLFDAPRRRAVLLDGTGALAPGFLDILPSSIQEMQALAVRLASAGQWLLVVVRPTHVRSALGWEGAHLPRWTVSPVEPLLQRAGLGHETELLGLLEGQLTAGLWGEDPIDRVALMRTHLAKGQLRDEVQRRVNLPPGGSWKPVAAEALVAAGGPTHRTVLFVAAFFPGLGPESFNRVVESLLVGRVRRVPAVGDTSATEASLLDEWREQRVALSGATYVTVSEATSGVQSVGFAPELQYLRDDVRDTFLRGPWFWEHQELAARLRYSRLLSDTEPAVVAAVIALLVDVARTDPREGLVGWLPKVCEALPPLPGAPPRNLEGFQRDLLALLTRQQALDRISMVLQALLRPPELRAPVATALAAILRQEGGFTLVELLTRIERAPGFDPIGWYRRVLDEGGGPARGAALAALFRLASRARGPIQAKSSESVAAPTPADDRAPTTNVAVDELFRWLRADVPVDRLPPSAHAAAEVLFAATLRVLLLVPADEALTHPLTASLWGARSEAPTALALFRHPAVRERAKDHGQAMFGLLLDWLFPSWTAATTIPGQLGAHLIEVYLAADPPGGFEHLHLALVAVGWTRVEATRAPPDAASPNRVRELAPDRGDRAALRGQLSALLRVVTDLLDLVRAELDAAGPPGRQAWREAIGLLRERATTVRTAIHLLRLGDSNVA